MIDLDTDWQLIDFEVPKKKAADPARKGTCQRCGKHIGKGLYRHELSCRGENA